jgi:hypothetical protein
MRTIATIAAASLLAATAAAEENQRRLMANRSKHKGVPRGGPSLLAGLLYCGRCGSRMVTCYRSNGRDLRYDCTRAALLTARNHHRVGSGTIAERAVDWDGYVGVIPRNSDTVIGPVDRWPTGYGFERFCGFLAGETSQWEPRLLEAAARRPRSRDDLAERLRDGQF